MISDWFRLIKSVITTDWIEIQSIYHKIYICPVTNTIVMKTDTRPQIIGIIAIIFGIVIILVPQLLSILVGIFLIAYGILEIIK